MLKINNNATVELAWNNLFYDYEEEGWRLRVESWAFEEFEALYLQETDSFRLGHHPCMFVEHVN